MDGLCFREFPLLIEGTIPMRKNRLIAAGFALIVAFMAAPLDAQAQRARAPARAEPQAQAQPGEKCLRALDGSCTNPAMVEAARLRAIIIPTVRVSYYGTPAGTVGGKYITFERLFQDNPTVFGLPTNTFFCCSTFNRTK